MIAFVDTNIIIGNCLKYDKWNYSSKFLFIKFKNIYCSNIVKKETLIKLNYLTNTYKLFFKEILYKLQECHISKNKFLKIVNDINYIDNRKIPFKSDQLAEILWIKGGFYESTDSKSLIKLLNKEIIRIEKQSQHNLIKCFKVIKIHERKEKYHSILNKLHSCKSKSPNNKIHSPDDKILLDAHDLSIINFSNIVNFITADVKMLEFKTCILNLTDIDNMCFINEIKYIK